MSYWDNMRRSPRVYHSGEGYGQRDDMRGGYGERGNMRHEIKEIVEEFVDELYDVVKEGSFGERDDERYGNRNDGPYMNDGNYSQRENMGERRGVPGTGRYGRGRR